RLRRPIAYQEINGARHEVPVKFKLNGHTVTFKLGAYDRNEPLTIDPVLIYSTFLGGNSGEQGLGIAVDSQGNAYVAGTTSSSNFPITSAFQNLGSGASDAFVV